jgi:excisionase family DNA binding protein
MSTKNKETTTGNGHGLKTKAQAARYLGISEPTLDRLRRERKIAFSKVGSGVRFTDGDLADFLASCRVERKAAGA